jgi:hypothetical protein
MKGSHCSLIAHKLLSGESANEYFFNQNHIRSHHKRLEVISAKVFDILNLQGFEHDHSDICNNPFYPIKNIGSQDGTPFKLKSGKITRCGVYVLEKKYRPALKKATLRMGW